jgi:hypothetical protein
MIGSLMKCFISGFLKVVSFVSNLFVLDDADFRKFFWGILRGLIKKKM